MNIWNYFAFNWNSFSAHSKHVTLLILLCDTFQCGAMYVCVLNLLSFCSRLEKQIHYFYLSGCEWEHKMANMPFFPLWCHHVSESWVFSAFQSHCHICMTISLYFFSVTFSIHFIIRICQAMLMACRFFGFKHTYLNVFVFDSSCILFCFTFEFQFLVHFHLNSVNLFNNNKKTSFFRPAEHRATSNYANIIRIMKFNMNEHHKNEWKCANSSKWKTTKSSVFFFVALSKHSKLEYSDVCECVSYFAFISYKMTTLKINNKSQS